MPSPFPGMNPYLEQDDAWHDFHEDFLPRVREEIAAQLPAHYIVKIDEHIYIHDPSAERRALLGARRRVRRVAAIVCPRGHGDRDRACICSSPG